MSRLLLEAGRQSIRAASIWFAMAVVLMASSRLAEARTGAVSLRLAKAAVLLGVGRATGTLHFEGQNYRLEVSGITGGTIGVGVVGGIKTARLQHSHSSVYLQLEGRGIGFELSAALGGVNITLQ
jgi:hypothetical protein